MSSITAVNFINTHSLNGGTFNATFVSLITGLLADLKTVYGLSGVTGLGDENISISDTSVTASDLNSLDGHTSGAINANSLNTLSGTAADLNTAYT